MNIEGRIARYAGQAITQFSMIEEGDSILLALSGGKDSYTLLEMLQRFRKRAPVRFDFTAVIIDSGFGEDYTAIQGYLESRNLAFHIQRTRIYEILKEKMPSGKTGNYCFLCSRLRRGVLYRIAKEKGFTKIALGHNLTDAAETLLLNALYNSRTDPMPPKYTAEKGVIIIRPLILVPENDIMAYSKEKGFPIVKRKCPFREEESKRHDIKKFVRTVSKENPSVENSLRNVIRGHRQKV